MIARRVRESCTSCWRRWRNEGTGNREQRKRRVIPSGAAVRPRNRGIAIRPVEGPLSGRLRFLDCAAGAAPLGMTPAPFSRSGFPVPGSLLYAELRQYLGWATLPLRHDLVAQVAEI